jgi:hypothetical protein
MKVNVETMTSTSWMYRAMAATTQNPNKIPNVTDYRIYSSEHSPIRTRWFWIELLDIPYFVHTHLRTHRVGGTEHFTQTGREDRGADSGERWDLVNHFIMINAQELINMSRVRLCNKAHKETREVMVAIKQAINRLDPELSYCMMSNCLYRNGRCTELKPCGLWENAKIPVTAIGWQEDLNGVRRLLLVNEPGGSTVSYQEDIHVITRVKKGVSII